jgi:uncharacterized protein (DUF1697 family)
MRYVAFLRAVNVGGHLVKMAELKREFDALGFANVSTFIASGNVIFESDESEAVLEPRIERHLHQWLGYAVGTFLRSDVEVRRIAAYEPFPDPGRSYVLILRSAPDAAKRTKMLDLATKDEPVAVHEREVYYLPTSFAESPLPGLLGKIVGPECTMRNVKTVRRLAAKFADDSVQPAKAQPARASRKRSGSASKPRP